MDPKVSLRLSRIDRIFSSAVIFVFVAYVAWDKAFIRDRFDNRQMALVGAEVLDNGVQMFAYDCGRYPTASEGFAVLKYNTDALKGWKGPYIRDIDLPDPWRRPYVYRCPGQHGPYDILSFGADGIEGGKGDNADIGNWSLR
jgi:type II secretion system protein G